MKKREWQLLYLLQNNKYHNILWCGNIFLPYNVVYCDIAAVTVVASLVTLSSPCNSRKNITNIIYWITIINETVSSAHYDLYPLCDLHRN